VDSNVNPQERPVGIGGGSSSMLAEAVAPFSVAVNVAVRFDATVPVEMLNVPAVAPAFTETDAGTANTGDALFPKVTTAPPGNAGCDRLTVQVVPWFDVSVVNVQEKDAGTGNGCNTTLVDAVVPFMAAVKVAV